MGLEALKNFLFILDKQAMFDKAYIHPVIWVWISVLGIYGCDFFVKFVVHPDFDFLFSTSGKEFEKKSVTTEQLFFF